MIYESLKQIEKRVEKEAYIAYGASHYLAVEKLKFDISDIASLKNLFVSYEVIDKSDEINLIPIEDKTNDITKLCKEWHISESNTDEIIDIISHCDGYFRVFEDYYCVAKGNVCDVFRVIQSGDELVLLELYKCD